MIVRRVIPIACVCACATFLGAAPSAAEAPSPFTLVFNGHDVVATYPSPIGVAHVGPFTSSSSLCPSGEGHDIAQVDQLATRLFTCDGTGATFTALINPHVAEHGGTGRWQIIAGTGALADLRGQGSFTGVLLSGDPDDLLSLVFRSTWAGSVGLDRLPPAISVTSLKKTGRRVRLRLSITDADSSPVSYRIGVVNSRLDTLARKSGHTSSGTVRLKFRAPAKGAARLRVDATDALGNTSSFTRSIRAH